MKETKLQPTIKNILNMNAYNNMTYLYQKL